MSSKKRLTELNKIPSKDENVAKLYWKHTKEMRPLIDSDEDEILIRGLKYFNQLMELNLDESPGKVLVGYEFFPRLFEIFEKSESTNVLIECLHLMNLFANEGLLPLDPETFQMIAEKANGVYETHDFKAYKELFSFLLFIAKNAETFTDILLDSFFIENSSAILLGSYVGLNKRLALFSSFVSLLIKTKFDERNIGQFMEHVSFMLSAEYNETAPFVIDTMITLEKLGNKIVFGKINTEYFLSSLSSEEGTKSLLTFLAMEENKVVFDAMWTPTFRQLLSGICVSQDNEEPENVMYFLLKIADIWRPESDDILIGSALLMIVNGKFIQRFAAAVYIQKLFSFGNLDFILDVLENDFLVPLSIILQETNDDLFEVSLNLAIMIGMTCVKCGYELDQVKDYNTVCDILDEIDLDDVKEEHQELIKSAKSYFAKEDTNKEGE